MIRYTQEQKEFIIQNNYMKSSKELADMFNNEFNTNVSYRQIEYYRHNHHLNSGLTGRFEKGHKSWNKGTKGLTHANKTSFKKGNIPQNHKPVGYERVNVDGYVEIKVAEPNVFKLKHRVIYENIYGKIPDNCNVVFADGNKLNLDPDNLILVSKSEMLIMNRNNLFMDEGELTKTGSIIAKVIDKTNKIKNERL